MIMDRSGHCDFSLASSIHLRVSAIPIFSSDSDDFLFSGPSNFEFASVYVCLCVFQCVLVCVSVCLQYSVRYSEV